MTHTNLFTFVEPSSLPPQAPTPEDEAFPLPESFLSGLPFYQSHIATKKPLPKAVKMPSMSSILEAIPQANGTVVVYLRRDNIPTLKRELKTQGWRITASKELPLGDVENVDFFMPTGDDATDHSDEGESEALARFAREFTGMTLVHPARLFYPEREAQRERAEEIAAAPNATYVTIRQTRKSRSCKKTPPASHTPPKGRPLRA